MSRRKRMPPVDVSEILSRPVRVTVSGTPKVMEPFEAELEQCVAQALKGNIAACTKFIRWCEQCEIVLKATPFDDHQYYIEIPKDWDHEEFHEMYDKHGPPPWPGKRDGLTTADRDKRQAERKRRRRT